MSDINKHNYSDFSIDTIETVLNDLKKEKEAKGVSEIEQFWFFYSIYKSVDNLTQIKIATWMQQNLDKNLIQENPPQENDISGNFKRIALQFLDGVVLYDKVNRPRKFEWFDKEFALIK